MGPRTRSPRLRPPRTVILAGLLTALALGYIGPSNAYLSQRAELHAQQSGLDRLEARHRSLNAQLAALERNDVLEARARTLGLVKPGERAFVIKFPPAE